ncbi:MAG: Lrp/AsnC family transcriptional regulator [Candidatus Diapherotrites archaeon]|nr:Lrp/AsnC family transcriptional regulator [Candidatus Diapherotrites archaeon]
MQLTYGDRAKLDEKDWKILNLLSQNARLPISRISHELNMNRDVVKYRLKKLIDEDVIAAFLTVTNLPRLGYDVWGHLRLTFKDLTEEREQEFMDHVIKNPEIVFAFSSLGRWDFGVEFYAETPGHFQELVKKLKNKFSDIIKETEVTIYVKAYKMSYVPNKPPR